MAYNGIRDIDIEKTWCLKSPLNFTRYFFKELYNRRFVIGKHHVMIADALTKVLNGEIKKLIINIAPRYGKCIDPDTRVLTNNGIKLAKEMRANDLVYSFDDGKVTLERCQGIEYAKKESVRITMSSGRHITCSSDHPMLSTFGYREASSLSPGDRIVALRGIIDGCLAIDENELDFITIMLFDGCCTDTLRFSNGGDSVLPIMLGACNNLGIGVKQYKCNATWDYNLLGGNSGVARELLVEYGLSGKNSHEKRIPSSWFGLSLKQKYRFLDLMFATDGYVSVKAGTLGITLANRGLIDDIQYMLSTIGVISNICYKPNDHYGAWALSIPRSESIKLLNKLTFFHKRSKALMLLNKKAVCITDSFPYDIIREEKLTYVTSKRPFRCTSSKNITRSKFERLASHIPSLGKYIHDDFYYDKIESIEKVGVIDLVHIGVDNTHNFIANGLVSHNTELAVKNFIAMGMGINPRSKFIHLSYSDDLARENSEGVQNIMNSPSYQRLFGTKPTTVKTKKWSTPEGGGLYAVSSGGQVTGFGAGLVEDEDAQIDENDLDEYWAVPGMGFGGAIVIDDPIKPDDALSYTIRENVNNKFDTTIKNRVNSRNTPIVIIMQRLHENDLCGFVMDQEPGEWTVLSIPCIQANSDTGEDEALWPFKHTLEELYKEQQKNKWVFDTQYMQNPQPKEGLMYESKFKTYVLRPAASYVIRKAYVDTADEGKDYLCAIIYDETDIGNFVLDVLYTQRGMEYTEPKLAEMLTKYSVDVANIESNNGGRSFSRAVERLLRQMGNNNTRIKWFFQSLNKESRIYSNSASVSNLTYFPERWDKLFPEFHRDIVSYMKIGTNKHDDAPDALTGTVEKREPVRRNTGSSAGYF